MVLQFTGRLPGIGQQSKVTWFLPRVTGTINEWQEERVLCKIRLPVEGFEEPKMQQLLAYEVARIMLASPFNRYAWVVEPPPPSPWANSRPSGERAR